ncbi:hypothetical protein DERP_004672 [Dermatophagoides pteronyssinus]|uniref:PDZ domain-containing protein n=1 Tax=Dermatophagoides pteronyssinus TaxID=6956 RepID=A0ABQ8JPP2_DERPT|nr:hypothetical protein DERP_004672 [Dermatophagoides pteronyssinus]
MSKSELNKTLDTKIEKQQQQNGNTFRRFPFRSQSLRLNSSEDGNHPRKFLRQQTVNGGLSSTTSLNNLILSKLLLKDRIQIIGGCDFGIPVIIVGLRQNSPAQNCGKIFIGDQILSVNDVPINENNTHNDTLRLLAECGPIVSLLLKHTKSVMNFDRKWKHFQQNFDKILLSNNHDEKNTDDVDLEAITTIKHRQIFLIIKGGKIFLFKCPPIETLLNYKRKFENLSFQQREKQRKYRTNSNGSSLGSVGSTTTTTTTTSDQKNELDLLAIEQSWHCYQSDFRCQLKPIEPIDNSNNNKQDSSFIITTNGLEAKYFSTECYRQLERLNNAWNLANYYSVLKNECKIYTVALEPLNIIGSFKIDWKMGFSFYDPKHNELIWSYQFYQLKHSSDDGQEILSLSFLIDSNDNHKNHHNVQIVQHVIRCSCLKTIIFSIHSFLRAKVFSLSISTTSNYHSQYSFKEHTTTIHQQSFRPLLSRSLLNQSSTIPKPAIRFNAQRLLSSSGVHNHAKIWVVEKVVSAALLAIIPAALIYPNPILDYCLAFSLVIHCHWGFEAIVVDYIRPSLVGNVLPKISLLSLYLVSMVALAGLFYLNYSDVGTATAIKMFAKM